MYSRLQAHIGLRQTKCVANLLMNFRLTNFVDVKFVKARQRHGSFITIVHDSGVSSPALLFEKRNG